MSNITKDVTTTVDTYIDMWNEENAQSRAKLIEDAWTSDARYRDPQLEAEGYSGLSEMVGTVHAHFPGHRFRRTSGIDQHHDQIRFGWELVAPDGSLTVAGIDVGTLTSDGRLSTITGFFGDLPEA